MSTAASGLTRHLVLDRVPMLPHDVAEVAALSRCLLDARLITGEELPTSGDDGALRRALIRLQGAGRTSKCAGVVARLSRFAA